VHSRVATEESGDEYYHFHLYEASHIVARDILGRECENDEAALDHAQDRGSLFTPDPPIARGSDCSVIKGRNETGKDIVLVLLPMPEMK